MPHCVFRPSDAGARPDKARNSGDRPKGESTPMGTVYVLENGQPKAVRISVGITDNRMTEVLGRGESRMGMLSSLKIASRPQRPTAVRHEIVLTAYKQ